MNVLQIKKTTSAGTEMVKLKEIVHLYKESENGVNLFTSHLMYQTKTK